jgi:putative addiction module CopG family antidote
MNIILAPDSEQYLREQIAVGNFPSADEAISEALRRMREYEMKMDQLRRDIAVGIEQADQGLAVEFNETTLERIKSKARQPASP